jgi:hypothetical protein
VVRFIGIRRSHRRARIEESNKTMTAKFKRAGRDRFPAPLEPADESSAPEPEERPAAPDSAPDPPESPEQSSPEALILQPPRPAERRAQEFLPQWLKRQGRAWPG